MTMEDKERAERLGAALRDNLRKRKAQAREGRSGEQSQDGKRSP